MPREKSSLDSVPSVVYYPAAGVKSDFEKLLTAFTETKTVRFERFVQIWKEMKMPLLFSGRQTDRECREFTEECMAIAVTFWMPPYNFQVRVGGLYLLYGLYFKQVFEPKVKIRLTIKQWQIVKSFEEEVKNQQHLDVDFILTQLIYHQSFHFVAHPTQLYPRKVLSIEMEPSESQKEVFTEEKSVIAELLEPDNIDQLSAIHDQYYRMKCCVAGPDATAPSSNLNVILPNLVQYITKAVASHEEWRKNMAGKKMGSRRRRDSGQTNTSESEVDSESEFGSIPRSPPKNKAIGSLRAAIRDKAYGSLGTAAKSRRHRQAVPEAHTEAMASSPRKSDKTQSESDQGQMSDVMQESDEDDVMSPLSTSGVETKSVLLNMPHFDADASFEGFKKSKSFKIPSSDGKSLVEQITSMEASVEGTRQSGNKVGKGRGKGQGHRKRKSGGMARGKGEELT